MKLKVFLVYFVYEIVRICPDTVGNYTDLVTNMEKIDVISYCIGIFHHRCPDDNVLTAGYCFTEEWICDGRPHCPDTATDEQRCQDYECPSGMFTCSAMNSTAKCFPHAFVCDGYDDCDDGSDETDELCLEVECYPDYFKCMVHSDCQHVRKDTTFFTN